jgi:anaerobic selenocysteine-containing dehydrogenase
VLGGDRSIDWQAMRHTGRIREAIGKVVPGMEKMREIDATRQEFHIGGRSFHSPRFATPDGRAVLHVHSLPDLAGGDQQLRLMTIRSEGQFNTVVYEDEDLYRGQDRRDVILMHPEDLARFQLNDGQRVTVRSLTGEMGPILARSFPRLKPGNAAMYYPEANALVPRHADAQSRTPAFKSIVVTVKPEP